MKSLPVDRLNYDLVLGNKVIFGTVNAHRQDFADGLAQMERIEQEYPGVLARLLTTPIPFGNAAQIFDHRSTAIKTVLRIAES